MKMQITATQPTSSMAPRGAAVASTAPKRPAQGQKKAGTPDSWSPSWRLQALADPRIAAADRLFTSDLQYANGLVSAGWEDSEALDGYCRMNRHVIENLSGDTTPVASLATKFATIGAAEVNPNDPTRVAEAVDKNTAAALQTLLGAKTSGQSDPSVAASEAILNNGLALAESYAQDENDPEGGQEAVATMKATLCQVADSLQATTTPHRSSGEAAGRRGDSGHQGQRQPHGSPEGARVAVRGARQLAARSRYRAERHRPLDGLSNENRGTQSHAAVYTRFILSGDQLRLRHSCRKEILEF